MPRMVHAAFVRSPHAYAFDKLLPLIFSARLNTAQGTGRFGWLHYFRSPSLPYDGRPETSRLIQAEPNIPANLPASLVLTRNSDSLRSAMRLILCTAIRASIGAENLIPEEVNYTNPQ